MEFDVGKWLTKALIVPGNFSDLMSYIESDDLLRTHVLSRNAHGIDGPFSISEMAEPFRELIITKISNNVSDAAERASAQMAVSVVTYIEGMISEFLACLFYCKPEKMHDYINIGSTSGAVGLSLILESSSKDEVIRNLSIAASEKAMQGKFEAALARLEKLTKIAIEQSLRDELVNLANIRNKIIHEAAEPTISVSDVHYYFDLMYSLLKHLGEAGVTLRLTLNDPANFVT